MTRWIEACAVDDIEREDVVAVVDGDRVYAVYRSEDDEFFATAGHCTHGRAPLCEGLVMDGVIECPRHNGRFDFRTGRALGAPVLVDLATYPVVVRDGRVHVDVDG